MSNSATASQRYFCSEVRQRSTRGDPLGDEAVHRLQAVCRRQTDPEPPEDAEAVQGESLRQPVVQVRHGRRSEQAHLGPEPAEQGPRLRAGRPMIRRLARPRRHGSCRLFGREATTFSRLLPTTENRIFLNREPARA